jgi:hypothetical protein
MTSRALPSTWLSRNTLMYSAICFIRSHLKESVSPIQHTKTIQDTHQTHTQYTTQHPLHPQCLNKPANIMRIPFSNVIWQFFLFFFLFFVFLFFGDRSLLCVFASQIHAPILFFSSSFFSSFFFSCSQELTSAYTRAKRAHKLLN